jgi:hypothetical protein
MLTLFGHPPLPPHPSPLTLAKSPAFSAAAKTEVRGYKGDPEQQQEKVDNVIFKKRILQRKTWEVKGILISNFIFALR